MMGLWVAKICSHLLWRQVALEREEILLELHEGRKAEEEAFKEQLEMEENIKQRLLLRFASLSTRIILLQLKK